jgi:hypothetical protein
MSGCICKMATLPAGVHAAVAECQSGAGSTTALSLA